MADGARGLPLPSDYGDTQGIVTLSTRLLEQAQHQRFLLERDQYRNVLYYLGIQWVTFDERLRTWIPQPTKRWAPKPVTNKLAAVIRPIVSQLAGEEPNLYLAPMTDRPEDVATAQVGSRALDVLYRETGLRAQRGVMARWLTLTGNIFPISGYDTGQGAGMTTVQSWQCLACGQDAAPLDWEEASPDGGYTRGICPMCGETAGSQPSMDETNQPRVTQYPRGRTYTELGSIFECFADLRAQQFKNSPWFQYVRTVTRNHLLDQYGEIAETVPAGGAGETGTRIRWFLDSLAYATQSGTSVYAGRLGLDDDRCYVRDFWFEHPKFPEGLYAVIAGEQVLKAGPFPYHTVDSTTAPPAPDQPPPAVPVRKPLRPVVHIGYEYVPGRLLYKTPTDDLARKQTTRNKLEAMIELHMRRSANTVWVVPQGSSITKVTGEEGIVLRYSPLAGGQPPQRQPGAEVPGSIWQYIQEIDKEMEDMMGVYDVLRGETPRGVRAAMALQLLEQRAQQGLSELLVNWSMGHQEWAEQVLGIFKEHGIDERFHSAMGDNGIWAVQKFSASDLRGAVRVEVEAGLGRPRTQVGKRAVLQQAIALSLVNPADPQERHRCLQILGMPELAKDMDLDQQAAARENDRWQSNDGLAAQGVNPGMLGWPDVRTPVDNHLVHLAIHRRFAIRAEWDALNPITQQFALAHMQAHLLAIQMAMVQGPGQNPRQSIPGSATNRNAGGSEGQENPQEGQAAIGEGATTLGSRQEMGRAMARPGGE